MKSLLIVIMMVYSLQAWTQPKTIDIPLHDTIELRVGDKIPDFIFRDTANCEMSLEQFRGKYVVVDVWASWCYPCKQEYPILRQLSEKYKDIVFVSLSCDTQKQRWLNELWWGKMQGYQWWIAGDESSMIAFRVSTIPRFILLNPKGKIINLKLPKPSSPEFEKILKEL